MDSDTLIAALVGALIATVPILISNLVQIYLHISENRQKEKEARIQDKKKWIERDILEIMDSVAQMLRLTSESQEISTSGLDSLIQLKDVGLLAQDEYLIRAKSSLERLNIVHGEINEKVNTISRLVYSFGDDISSEYDAFAMAMINFHKTRVNLAEKKVVLDADAWFKVKESAGKFQKALRNKLISIRDT
jgi:hypothetical protein